MVLAAFREVRLPSYLAFGSTFGPESATELVPFSSGHEARTVLWPQHRHRGELRYHNRTLVQLQALDAFFRVSRGRAMGWRFLDHKDHVATQQFVGIGDGATTQYQLLKIYDSGLQADQYVRIITKPVGIDMPYGSTENTVKLYLDGTLLESGYGVDYTTGRITLAFPLPVGVTLTASFLFDVPCRFDTDYLPLSLSTPAVGGTAKSAPIVELLPFVDFPAELAA
jgi:uncharacterized protein (TIGR02217 family)